MERMLKLVIDGAITVASIEKDRGLRRKIKPMPQANLETGKESNQNISFSAVTWGKATRSWGKNALTNLNKPQKIEKVMQEAKVFERAAARRLAGGESESEEDERALLSDASDSDDEAAARYAFRLPITFVTEMIY
jgi:hypothetical protein